MTSDENVWSGLVGGLPYALVRTGFDQMAFQRFMAARTMKDAKRIVLASAVSVILFFVIIDVAAVALIYWYRDCDPLQSEATMEQTDSTSSRDQNLPEQRGEPSCSAIAVRLPQYWDQHPSA
ncbi:hypothetical protein MTO96_020876 [Rhipicephalus appendiculatus]